MLQRRLDQVKMENILKSTGENAMLEEFLRNVSLEEQTDIADGKPTGAKELAAAVVVSTSAVGKFALEWANLPENLHLLGLFS